MTRAALETEQFPALCMSCGERPAENRKRQQCRRCVMRSRRGTGLPVMRQPASLAWLSGAACRDTDPELYFDATRKIDALRVCGSCPVIAECLAFADAAETVNHRSRVHGIYGGQTPERRIARRKSASRLPA